jgi:5-(carboxyamino)imidazole ribonucleotide synthase
MNDASRTLDYLPPPACIGILGAGQLGKMLVQAAQTMGYQTIVLDPDAKAPAAQVSQEALQFEYDDPKGLEQLALKAARVTTEFENVPALTLQVLSEKIPVRPSAYAVSVAQDRIIEKNMIRSCQLQTAPFHVINHPDDVQETPLDFLPGILKTARLGYDGKGQVVVNNLSQLQLAYSNMNAKTSLSVDDIPCVLEKKLPLLAEYSVIVARNELNEMVCLPIQCNEHINGILHLTSVFEHALDHELAHELTQAAKTIAQNLSYIGVLCVEFFVLQQTSPNKPGPLWVVNEIAPRPHNSGHHSLDSCDISQFELQLRTLCGLPLIAPRQHSPCVMLNLLGDLWFKNGPQQALEPPWNQLLVLPGTHLHLYGKKEPRLGRKMGHLNITGHHPKEVLSTLSNCLDILQLPPISNSPLARY